MSDIDKTDVRVEKIEITPSDGENENYMLIYGTKKRPSGNWGTTERLYDCHISTAVLVDLHENLSKKLGA